MPRKEVIRFINDKFLFVFGKVEWELLKESKLLQKTHHSSDYLQIDKRNQIALNILSSIKLNYLEHTLEGIIVEVSLTKLMVITCRSR